MEPSRRRQVTAKMFTGPKSAVPSAVRGRSLDVTPSLAGIDKRRRSTPREETNQSRVPQGCSASGAPPSFSETTSVRY